MSADTSHRTKPSQWGVCSAVISVIALVFVSACKANINSTAFPTAATAHEGAPIAPSGRAASELDVFLERLSTNLRAAMAATGMSEGEANAVVAKVSNGVAESWRGGALSLKGPDGDAPESGRLPSADIGAAAAAAAVRSIDELGVAAAVGLVAVDRASRAIVTSVAPDLSEVERRAVHGAIIAAAAEQCLSATHFPADMGVAAVVRGAVTTLEQSGFGTDGWDRAIESIVGVALKSVETGNKDGPSWAAFVTSIAGAVVEGLAEPGGVGLEVGNSLATAIAGPLSEIEALSDDELADSILAVGQGFFGALANSAGVSAEERATLIGAASEGLTKFVDTLGEAVPADARLKDNLAGAADVSIATTNGAASTHVQLVLAIVESLRSNFANDLRPKDLEHVAKDVRQALFNRIGSPRGLDLVTVSPTLVDLAVLAAGTTITSLGSLSLSTSVAGRLIYLTGRSIVQAVSPYVGDLSSTERTSLSAEMTVAQTEALVRSRAGLPLNEGAAAIVGSAIDSLGEFGMNSSTAYVPAIGSILQASFNTLNTAAVGVAGFKICAEEIASTLVDSLAKEGGTYLKDGEAVVQMLAGALDRIPTLADNALAETLAGVSVGLYSAMVSLPGLDVVARADLIESTLATLNVAGTSLIVDPAAASVLVSLKEVLEVGAAQALSGFVPLVSISGQPTDVSTATATHITVGGERVTGYRYRLGIGTECEDLTTYGQIRLLTSEPTIDEDLTRRGDGLVGVCVVGCNGKLCQGAATAAVATWTKDTDAPVPGAFMASTNVSGIGFTIRWSAGADLVESAANLQYFVCTGASAAAIDTVAECEGGTRAMDWTANTLTLAVSGKRSGTTYYFNAVVRDQFNHKAIYNGIAQATTAPATPTPTATATPIPTAIATPTPPPVASGTNTVTLSPVSDRTTQDTHYSNSPPYEYGSDFTELAPEDSEMLLAYGDGDDGDASRAILEFELPTAVKADKVTAAHLHFYGQEASGSPESSVYRIYGYAGNGQVDLTDAYMMDQKIGENVSMWPSSWEDGTVIDATAFVKSLSVGDALGTVYPSFVIDGQWGQGRLFSSNSSTVASRPTLTVTYSLPTDSPSNSVEQYIGTSSAIDPDFVSETASHTKQHIDFDNDGFDLADHAFTPIPSTHYSSQGVTLLNLDARSVGTTHWAHSPPIGAWHTGFSKAISSPYSFVFVDPIASFGMFANDLEGNMQVTLTLTTGTKTFTVPAQGGASTGTFLGFRADGNVIRRIDFECWDYHIIDDVQFGTVQ